MKKSEKFISFLESLKDTSNAPLIDAVYEAFVLTEASVRGVPMPDVKSPERRRLQSKSAPLSPEEQDANSARFKREGSAAKQAGGRASGSMSQIVKYAMTAPLDVEKWMNETLKPAIKQGKLSMDQQFGTDSAKVGFGQRIKNMGKAMLGEGAEVDYTDDYDSEIEEDDEDEFGGFQSNKGDKRNAQMRRNALAEGMDGSSGPKYFVEKDDGSDYKKFNTAREAVRYAKSKGVGYGVGILEPWNQTEIDLEELQKAWKGEYYDNTTNTKNPELLGRKVRPDNYDYDRARRDSIERASPYNDGNYDGE